MRMRAADWALFAGLGTPLLFVTGPFLWLVMSSFKTENEISMGDPLALPAALALTNYLDAWRIGSFGQLLNAAAVVLLTLLLCVPAGYAFAKMRFFGNNTVFFLILVGLTIPIQAIVIPVYQMIARLGLIDTIIGVTLAQVGNGIPFGLFLMRNFFRALPDELLEAARIDGASHLRILTAILLPLATPAVLALTVIAALSTWNDFFLPLVVLISADVQTIPLGLVRFAGTYSADKRMIFAGTVISFVPILVLYLLTQRTFVQGLTQGAMKG